MKINVEKGTIVLADITGYSSRARFVEETLGVAALAQLNSGIQALIDTALVSAGTSRSDRVVAATGDGALLHFEAADQALRFAVSLLAVCASRNASRTDPLAQLLFRIGIGTGDIAIDSEATLGNGLAGMAIVRAARLEPKADDQGILIDPETYDSASSAVRTAYVGPVTVDGKHGETFLAYRYASQSSASGAFQPSPADPIDPGDQRQRRELVRKIIAQLKALTRAAQIQILESGLGIPPSQRPSDTLTIEQRGLGLLNWAEAENLLALLHGDLIALLGTVSGKT